MGIGLLVGITATANVLSLGMFRDALQDFVFGYEVDDSAASQNRESGEALAKQIEEEGVVMVKNENNVIPFDKDVETQINVFGWSSTIWIPGGSGSGRVVKANSNSGLYANTGFLEALHKYGIETNEELTNFYKSYANSRPGYENGTLNTYDYQFHRLIEPEMGRYSDELLDNALNYSDTAVVVLGRVSGESSDAPLVQYKGSNVSSQPNDTERTYLDASLEELALLDYVASNYDKVVVVINSTNTMNLSFLDDIEGLSGCLVVGGTGVNAATGVVSVLYGDANPSGKLADTYPYDFKTNASYANSGSEGIGSYTNSSGLYPADGTTNGNVGNNSQRYDAVSYLDYVENIYVGYKWYETADAEGYWDDVDNDYGKGYDGVVQYPFGFGLSNTSFSWDIVGLNHAHNSNLAKNDEIKVTVRVTNTGEIAGKDVVELYYTPKYNKGGIEKSAINLAAFAKTALLEPGLFEDVELTFNVEDMASYDYNDANGNGIYGYELEAGDYEIKLMTDSHHLKEMSRSTATVHDNAVITYKVNSNLYYDVDSVSGLDVYNKFDTDGYDGVAIDGSDSDSNIEYMSRADFDSTFPEAKAAARAMSNNVKALNLYTAQMATADNDDSDENPTFGANNGLKVYENGKVTDLGLELGADPEHAQWDSILDQLTEAELRNLTLHGYIQTAALGSVGKERHRAVDGPNQIGSFNVATFGTGFPNATLVAQTWSTKLAYDLGLALGAEARTLNYEGWYGPGINIHRSPFGGRNYEYFSEDAYLTGIMASQEIKGAKNQGVYCFLKHLVCYEQESMRDGIYVWLTEQSLREIYLKPFKLAIQVGGANGIMTSYNRIGAVWAGGSKALITGVVREEWDFQGIVLTDYADHHKFMNGDQQLRAGGDIWMDGFNNNGQYQFGSANNSNTFRLRLREAGKHVLYGWLNAAYTQSIYDPSEDEIQVVIGKKGAPVDWWVGALYGVDVAVGVIAVGLVALIIVPGIIKKNKKSEDSAE